MRTGQWTRRQWVIYTLALCSSALSGGAVVVGAGVHYHMLRRAVSAHQWEQVEPILTTSSPLVSVVTPIAAITGIAFWVAMLLSAVLCTQGPKRDHRRWVWVAVIGLTGWFGAVAYWVSHAFTSVQSPRRPTGLPRGTEAEPPPQPAADEPGARSAHRACLLDTALGRYTTLPLALLAAASTLFFLISFFARPELLFEFGPLWPALMGLAGVFWVLMIVDAVQRLSRDTQYPRLHWLLAVLLTGVFGALAYYGSRVIAKGAGT